MKTETRSSRRTTMPLTGSIRHAELRLSVPALVAAHLAARHIARAHRLRPTLSAVTRRALLDYCKKTEAMTPEERQQEAMRVLRASKATPLDREDLDRALAAVEACGEGDPLPSLDSVLRPLTGAVDPAALDARVSSLLKAMCPRRFPDG